MNNKFSEAETEHMKAVASRIAKTVKKKGTSYAMKYLIHVAGWGENEAKRIVKYAQKYNEEKPPA